MLLEAKADVNTTSGSGFSPLRVALGKGKKECVQCLIASGCDVMCRDVMGETLLMAAVCQQDWDNASLLLSVGGPALLSARNFLGQTCIHMLHPHLKDNSAAVEWLDAVGKQHSECETLIKEVETEQDQASLPLERLRGSTWSVSLKRTSQVSLVLFRHWSTVRASQFFCPTGEAGYYELQLESEVLYPQWGFSNKAFDQIDDEHMSPGVGDDGSSWGVDGQRLFKWHNGRSPFAGRAWQKGDVIGLACDLRSGSHAVAAQDVQQDPAVIARGGSIWVSLNGDFSPPYGLVFRLPEGLEGLFAAFTTQNGAVRCNLGEESFKYAPPAEGFKPISSFHARVP
jgi:hypothetical protein